MGDAAAGPTELPKPWRRIQDKVSGNCYYYNRETRQTQWEVPVECEPSCEEDAIKMSWMRHVDSTGKAYYYNSKTRETTWEAPTDEGVTLPTMSTASTACDGQASPPLGSVVDEAPSCPASASSCPASAVSSAAAGVTTQSSGGEAPAQWHEKQDPVTRAVFYWDPTSGEEWQRYIDQNTGHFYVHNRKTNEVKWWSEVPAPAPAAVAAPPAAQGAWMPPPGPMTASMPSVQATWEAASFQPAQPLHALSAPAAWLAPCQGADVLQRSAVQPSVVAWSQCQAAPSEAPVVPTTAATVVVPEHLRKEGVHELLQPLMQLWHSPTLGFLEARRPRSAEVLVEELDVCVAGESWEVLGRIVLDASKLFLEVAPAGGASAAQRLKLDGDRSRPAKQVVWKSDNGAQDTWDGKFTEALLKADHEVRSRGLVFDLGAALRRLRAPPPQPSGVWSWTPERPQYTVGLCVTTMNRGWQLREALPLNLLHCWPHRAYAKIHVVEFGSSDGTLRWLLKKCGAAIKAGVLCVYTTDEMKSWHASIAKNTAHMVASEDILVNLDGDNLIGPEFPLDVIRHFVEGKRCVHYEDGDGTCGRIAVFRQDFHMVRGYDEDCHPMGAQDIDLVRRMQQIYDKESYKKVRKSPFSQAIPNSVDQKIESCIQTGQRRLRWGQMDMINRELFEERRANGQVKRNLGKKQLGVRCWVAGEGDIT